MLDVEKIKARILRRIVPNEAGCWVWQGAKYKDGYGNLGPPIGSVHRASYQVFRGPIPIGLEIDHLCKNRSCCNPVHLAAVTHIENVRRSERSTRATCKRGHPYDEGNLYRTSKQRICRICNKAAVKRYQKRKGIRK